MKMSYQYYKFAFLFVILLSVITVKPTEASTWGTFKIAHILDPDSEERTYYNWNTDEWVTWLHSRDELDKYERGGKHNQKSITSKGINSVIIASPTDIIESFSDTSKLFKNNKKDKLYWSDSNFLIYTLKKTNRGTYQVYRCEHFYFVAALDSDKRPVHFHACGPQIMENYVGNYQFPWNRCSQI